MSKLFSGIQPSGQLHIGNYLGAMKNWLALQDEHEAIFCVVDYHAITVPQKPEILQKNIIELSKAYLAMGINPDKSVIFQQSDIKEHTELAWVLNCVSARISDLNKMTQFKDKAGKNQENVSVGLYDYPVLMASDILLYQTEIVPVGEDQVQHIELTRDLAKRFNVLFGETFVLPKPVLNKNGARIMGLDKPENKMSKSAGSENNYISLLDEPNKAKKKIMRATTDSETNIHFDKEKKPGISNLLNIYSLLTDISIPDLETKYQGKQYGDFKKDLAEVVAEFLNNFQEKYNKISDGEVKDVLKNGAKKIQPIAQKTMEEVKRKIGILK